MRDIFKILFVLLTLQSLPCGQQAFPVIPRFEFGAYLGQPIGLSAKYWFNSLNAVDIVSAWSFTEDGIFELDADYLLHYFPQLTKGEIPLYVGVGAGFRIGDDWFIGARFPIGAEYIFENFPISVFAEVSPQWQIDPDSKFVVGGGVGIRVTLGRVTP